MRPWYCVQTHPNQEPQVKLLLERQGFPICDPGFLVKTKCRHILRKRLFTGYLFVSFDDLAHWPRVKNTQGVANVITQLSDDIPQGGNIRDIQYRMPMPISETIETLRAQALAFDEVQRGGKARAPQQVITAGCYVRVLAGVLKDEKCAQRALVEWADHDRAALMLDIFKRKVRVEFYHRDLELLAS